MENNKIIEVDSTSNRQIETISTTDIENQNNNDINCHCNRNRFSKNINNIGDNRIITNCITRKKTVIGIDQSFCLFFLIFLAMFLTIVIWLASNNSFFNIYLYIIGVTLYLLTAYYMLLCYLTEPGIIPRSHPDYIIKEDSSTESDEEKKKINKADTVKPSIFTERKCETCNIVRPPRASHCRHCDNCVLNLDQ